MTLVFPKLPDPSIIDESTFEEIFDRKITNFRTRYPQFTNALEGDPIYAAFQDSAYDELNLRKRINHAYMQTLLAYATGTNLDNVVANYGLTRQVKEEATFDDDGVELTAEVLETDEALRLRGYLIWHSLSTGSFGHYKTHALNASPQVKDAFPKNTANGEVTVYIQSEGEDGGVPSPSLLTTVRNYMNVLRRRTLCDTLVVEGITTVDYTIEATITVEQELDQSTILEQVREEAEDFADEVAVINQDIPLSRFYAVLSPVGVAGVTLTSPTADITTTDSQVPYATAITITAA